MEFLLQISSEKHKKLQNKLMKPIKKSKLVEFETHLENTDPVGWTIYSSGRDPLGSAWLHAIPKSEALIMQPELFRSAYRTRLLIEHPYIGSGTMCSCGK